MKQKFFIIFSQLGEDRNTPNQLSLPLASPQKSAPQAGLFCRKPQIANIPGASIKEKNRYRVQPGDVLLGARLDIDAALKLAKGGKL
jgi:hypothetical protein